MGLTRDVWNLSEQDFPGTSPIESQLLFLLRYAILAPSVRNTQPWTFQIEGNAVHLHRRVGAGAAGGRSYATGTPHQSRLRAGEPARRSGALRLSPRGGLLPPRRRRPARRHDHLFPGGAPMLARASIALRAILERHNDNSVYRSTPVPEEVCRPLQACQMEPELRLNLTDDHLFHRWIERFTLDADRQEFADPEYREELGYWIGQGVLRGPGLAAKLGGLAVARLDLGESVAEQDYKVVDSAALLGVISATDDTHLTHIRDRTVLRAVLAHRHGDGSQRPSDEPDDAAPRNQGLGRRSHPGGADTAAALPRRILLPQDPAHAAAPTGGGPEPASPPDLGARAATRAGGVRHGVLLADAPHVRGHPVPVEVALHRSPAPCSQAPGRVPGRPAATAPSPSRRADRSSPRGSRSPPRRTASRNAPGAAADDGDTARRCLRERDPEPLDQSLLRASTARGRSRRSCRARGGRRPARR